MKYILATATLLLILGCTPTEPTIANKVEKSTKTVISSVMRKEALIVGVSDYEGDKADLDGVKKDIKNMKKLFTKWGFHVTVIPEKDSVNLEEYLKDYVNLNANDKFIFYYSGHGGQVADENGDEIDGKDEVLVLSDGITNQAFLDDTLNGYMNMIEARKMILFDSCHSGTAFKAFGNKPKPKSLMSYVNHIMSVIKTRLFEKDKSTINSGEYVVFSAAQDNEESLDTVNGGMFTTSFYNQVNSNNGENIRMMNLKVDIEDEIEKNCKPSNSTPYHPNLSASSIKLKYSTIKEFLEL